MVSLRKEVKQFFGKWLWLELARPLAIRNSLISTLKTFLSTVSPVIMRSFIDSSMHSLIHLIIERVGSRHKNFKVATLVIYWSHVTRWLWTSSGSVPSSARPTFTASLSALEFHPQTARTHSRVQPLVYLLPHRPVTLHHAYRAY